MRPGSSPRWRACSPPATGSGSRCRSTWTSRSPVVGRPRAAGRGRRGRRGRRLAAVALLGHTAARNAEDRDLLVGLLRPQVPVGAPASGGDRPGPDHAIPRSPTSWSTTGRVIRRRSAAAILDTLLSRSGVDAALCSRRSRTAACRRPRSTRPAGSGSSTAAIRRSAPAPRPSSPTRPGRAGGRRLLSVGPRHQGRPRGRRGRLQEGCASRATGWANEGVEVGPDLATLNDKSPESLLIAILDPNRAFESKYAAFTVATVDGRVLNGLIASESATSVTLRRQDGKDDVLLRSEIEEMAASGQSLMPEGLEKDLKPRDLADLIAYLATAGPARKRE